MASLGKAAVVTHVDLSADRIINADGIWVHAILVSNASANDVEVAFYDIDDGPPVAVGSNLYLQIAVPAHNSFSIETEWVAKDGLSIDSLSDADVTVTVFHSHPGR